MARIGVLFDIDDLGGGFYGFAAYQALFTAVGKTTLHGCSLADGDTRATLNGDARHYCIALQTSDAAQADAIRAAVSQATTPGFLPVGSRFVDESALAGEPLVEAGRIDASGQLVGCDTDWIEVAWQQAS